MLFLWTYAERRKLFWRWAHYWSMLRLQKRVVLASVLLGILSATIVSWATPKVYASKVVIDAGVCVHGMPLGSDFCSNCWHREPLPGLVQIGRTLDDMVQHLGITGLSFERLATNYLARRHR